MRRFAGVVCLFACAGCGGTVETTSPGGTGAAGDATGGETGGLVGSGGVVSAGGSGVGASAATGGVSGAGTGGATVVVDPATRAARARACDHWFAAQSTCTVPALPADETAQLTARFEASCTAAFEQPGTTETAADVDACAAALENWPCGSPDGPPLECDIRGSLAGGAPCISNTQCASGACNTLGPLPTPGGLIAGAITCGTCAAVAALGQSCNAAMCAKGSSCRSNEPSAPDPEYTCVAISEVGEGSSCDGGIRFFCKPGLYCNASSDTCVLLGKLGDACTGLGPAGCVTPLVCSGSPATCTAPGPAGTFCGNIVDGNTTSEGLGDWGCASGLACATTGECEPVTWADPGQACDGVLTYCRQGSCPTNAITGGPIPSTCPNIVPDGTPCSDTDTCDADAECVNATATAHATTGVCEQRTTVVCR